MDTMVPAIAARSGKTPLDVCYDLMLDVQGAHAGVLWRPVYGYEGSIDGIVDALECDHIVPGFDDAGAHCTILTDATTATWSVAYFHRDRTSGRRLPLERLVKLQTSDAAAMFGLHDRGVLEPGKRADINVMDL